MVERTLEPPGARANGNVLSTEQALEALARHCPGLFALAFEGLMVELADVRERLVVLEAARVRG